MFDMDEDMVEIPAIPPAPTKAAKAKHRAVPATQVTDDDFFSEAVATPKPSVSVTVDPVANNSSVVEKMRRIFGAETKTTRVPIYVGDSTDPVFTYTMRKVTPDDQQSAVTYCRTLVSDGGRVVGGHLWDMAVIAFSVCGIDEGPLLDKDSPTPAWKALGIVPENSAHVRNPMLPSDQIRLEVAKILLPLFTTELVDIGNTLNNHYILTFDNEYIGTKKKPAPPKKEEEPEGNPTTPAR